MLRIRDLPNLSEQDIRLHERGRLAAVLVAVLMMNLLFFFTPDMPSETYASADTSASAER